jgi:hypothetical protein
VRLVGSSDLHILLFITGRTDNRLMMGPDNSGEVGIGYDPKQVQRCKQLAFKDRDDLLYSHITEFRDI